MSERLSDIYSSKKFNSSKRIPIKFKAQLPVKFGAVPPNLPVLDPIYVDPGMELNYNNGLPMADRDFQEPAGWNFMGWFNDPSMTDVFIPDTPINGDPGDVKTLYGKWMQGEDMYMVQYAYGDGENPLPDAGLLPLFPMPDDPNAPNIPVDYVLPGTKYYPKRDHPGTSNEVWSFLDWYKDPDMTEKWVEGTPINQEAITLYGSWIYTATAYEITYIVGPNQPNNAPKEALEQLLPDFNPQFIPADAAEVEVYVTPPLPVPDDDSSGRVRGIFSTIGSFVGGFLDMLLLSNMSREDAREYLRKNAIKGKINSKELLKRLRAAQGRRLKADGSGIEEHTISMYWDERDEIFDHLVQINYEIGQGGADLSNPHNLGAVPTGIILPQENPDYHNKDVGVVYTPQPPQASPLYSFIGWYTSPNTIDKNLYVPTNLQENTTLYGRWEFDTEHVEVIYEYGPDMPHNVEGNFLPTPNPHRVAFSPEKYDALNNMLDAPGFQFMGWFYPAYDSDGTLIYGPEYSPITLEDDLLLIGKWSQQVGPLKWNVYFAEGNSHPQQANLPPTEHGAVDGQPYPGYSTTNTHPVPIPTGAPADFNFIKWTTDTTGVNEYDPSLPITQSFTLYAQWSQGTGQTSVYFENYQNDGAPGVGYPANNAGLPNPPVITDMMNWVWTVPQQPQVEGWIANGFWATV